MYRTFALLLPLIGCGLLPNNTDQTGCEAPFLMDNDGDGFPAAPEPGQERVYACEAPDGYVSAELEVDCDDNTANVHPDAEEHCDGIDENCNGAVDEIPVDGYTYYVDLDLDGFGDESRPIRQCEALPSGEPQIPGGDCDDEDPDRHPDAEETCNGLDDDCNGTIDDGMQTGTFWSDVDGDGYGLGIGVDACIAPVGYAPNDGDCAEWDASVHPDAPERCNGLDDDCDGDVGDEEADEDGDGYTACSGDCDDTSADALPGGVEVCDALDNDCDGTTNNDAVDAYESNNTREEAPIVAQDNETVTLTATISGPDDRSDWYAMDTTDDPDNLLNGDAFIASFTVTNLPPGVEASLHMYRYADVPGAVRHVMVDDSWEDGILHVERGGVWLGNDGNMYWAHLEIHSGFDCNQSYSIELSNHG